MTFGPFTLTWKKNEDPMHPNGCFVTVIIDGDKYTGSGLGKTKQDALASVQFQMSRKYSWDQDWLERYINLFDVQEPLL